jgi:hypothetical protein
LLGLWWLWRILSRYSPAAALAGALVFSTWFSFVDGSIQGMETPLFLMAILGMWNAHLEQRPVARGFWGGITGLTRPEGVLLLGAVLIVALFRRFRSALLSAAIAGVMGIGWVLVALRIYGSALPNSALAKASTSLNAVHSFANFSLYLAALCLGLPDTVFLRLGTTGTSALGAGLIIILILLLWHQFRHQNSFGVVLWVSLLAFIAFYLIGHPGRIFSWYGIPSCLCFLLLISLNLPSGLLALLRSRSALVVVLLALVLCSTGLLLPRAARIRESVGGRYLRVSEWLLDHTSSEDLVATGDIGLIGWMSKRRILDLGALVSRDLALEHATRDSVFLGDLMDTYHPRVFILDRSLQGHKIAREDFIHYYLFRNPAQRRRWQDTYELLKDTEHMGKAIYFARSQD